MTIKEIEERTGMDRANIRFYEKEGLLAPERLANGYRDYTEQDAETLLRIKLLRSLHVSLDDIRAAQTGTKTLESIMQAQLRTLEQEQNTLAAAEEVCRTIQNSRARFENLNAEKYLRQLNDTAQADRRRLAPPAEDAFCPPRHPWRRFFARGIDLNLYSLPLELFCLLTLRINPDTQRGSIASIICEFLSFVLMLLLEPVFLHYFAATPGKWIFGLRVSNIDGSKLSYKDALLRTWRVIFKGYGLQIPGYKLYRFWKCYKLCMDGQEQDWDEFPIRRLYTIKDTKPWRNVTFLIVTGVIAFITLFATELSALPPNFGNLTVAEFAENYNYLFEYYNDDAPSYTLDTDGSWKKAPSQPGVVVLDVFENSTGPLPLEYTVDADGNLTGFSISKERQNIYNLYFSDDYMLTALAFARAQPEGGVFSNVAGTLSERLDNLYGDVAFHCAGLDIQLTVELLPGNSYANTHFSVTKEPQY